VDNFLTKNLALEND
jgi:hypothetical protein